MAFRWHSPLVSQEGIPSQAPSKAPPPPPPEVHYDPAQQRAIRGAHAAACEAIECFAVPDASGKANNPATIIRAVEAAGMRLGPQGAGTLLAFADAGRKPSLDEFLRLCVETPGTQATVLSPASGPGSRTGPGLRAAFGGGGRPVEGRGAGAGGGRAAVPGGGGRAAGPGGGSVGREGGRGGGRGGVRGGRYEPVLG